MGKWSECERIYKFFIIIYQLKGEDKFKLVFWRNLIMNAYSHAELTSLETALNLSQQHIQFIQNLFAKEQIAIPSGYYFLC